MFGVIDPFNLLLSKGRAKAPRYEDSLNFPRADVRGGARCAMFRIGVENEI
jgi:hypothetical protein